VRFILIFCRLYLVEDAKYLINVDAQVAEQVRKSTCEGGGRYSFDPAEVSYPISDIMVTLS